MNITTDDLRAGNALELKEISIGLGICAAVGVIVVVSFALAASHASNPRPWIIAASSVGGLPIALSAVGSWALFIMKDELQELSEDQLETMIEDFNKTKTEKAK